MNRELAIGLIFLGLLLVIAALGLGLAWWVQRQPPADNLNEVSDRRKSRLFRDLDTYVIPRSTVYKAVAQETVSGVEPVLARAESWPLRQRH